MCTSYIQHVISYAGLSLAILFVKLPPEQNATSDSSLASISVSRVVRSAIFRILGRRSSREAGHVIVVRVRAADNSNSTRKDEPRRSQTNFGISLPGVGPINSVVPT